MDTRIPAARCDSFRVFVVLPVSRPAVLLQQQQQQQALSSDGGDGCVPPEAPKEKRKILTAAATSSTSSSTNYVRNGRIVRHAYTAEEKTDAVARVLAGATIPSVAKDTRIPASTIRGWMKNSCKFVQLGDTWTCMGDPVDICMHKWFLQRCGLGLSISNMDLREQAQRFRYALNDKGPDINCGWVTRWKMKNSVRDCGDALVIEMGDDQCCEFVWALDQYTDEQIYNCNETILYYKLLPSNDQDLQTIVKTQSMNESKVTLLFCVNKSGNHKLKPLCIGNTSTSQNDEHMIYKRNVNSWIDRDIFSSWFKQFFVPAVRDHLTSNNLQPKALLILDNCSAHQTVLASEDGLIQTKFFIKSLPSTYQPIEQGLMQTVKKNYRTELLQSLIDSDLPSTNFLDHFNYRNFASLLIHVWEKISRDQIVACWDNCFLFNFKGQFAEQPKLTAPLNINIDHLRTKLKQPELTQEILETWSVIEKDALKCQSLTDQEIIESIVEEQNEPPEKRMKTTVAENRPIICPNVRPVDWRKRPDSAIQSYYERIVDDLELDLNHNDDDDEEEVDDFLKENN
ncbi:PREDICTED: jerky protein homolog-like [Nicrophorus vespilloides]|uniref:Jerky protein homolog-like n=1 Tax=Nicrophorus vespilloides TaxID=110193 RepID=A0ABM1MDF4_NICVS|nr:PREDICTED: jerky protein homolog-like [Nicrophorus vespilloides]